jgi:hypothetical protein
MYGADMCLAEVDSIEIQSSKISISPSFSLQFAVVLNIPGSAQSAANE